MHVFVCNVCRGNGVWEAVKGQRNKPDLSHQIILIANKSILSAVIPCVGGKFEVRVNNFRQAAHTQPRLTLWAFPLFSSPLPPPAVEGGVKLQDCETRLGNSGTAGRSLNNRR